MVLPKQRADNCSGKGARQRVATTLSDEVSDLIITRAQWPHTVDDIVKSLDGIWGLVGAVGTNGNLFRLERSLQEPLKYSLTEYKGTNEEIILSSQDYPPAEKTQAIEAFAKKLGF